MSSSSTTADVWTAHALLIQQPRGLSLVLDDLPVGVIVADNTGALLLCNREAERIFGPCNPARPFEWCRERKIYRPDKKTLYLPAEIPLTRALRGEEVVNELMFVRNAAFDAGLWVRGNSRPLRNATADICGAVAVHCDVTEHRETIERLNLLALAVEQTADSVIITNRGGTIEYVNSAFETTTGYSRWEALGRTPAILKSGRHDAAFYARMWATIQAGLAFRDTLVNRKKDGEVYFAEQTITPIRSAEGEITHFVSVLKDVTALRKQQEQSIQLELARAVQKRLQADLASIPGVRMGAASLPALETGGDYFDAIPVSGASLMIAMGDVSGHGVHAALGMALTRAYVRCTSGRGLHPAAALSSVNNLLCGDLNGSDFVTLVLVELDLSTRTLTYASAGHIPALLIDDLGSFTRLDSTGVPLGLFRDAAFACGVMPIRAGQTLVLLTDGITEAAEQFGIEQIVDYVRCRRGASAQQIADGICHTALALADDAAPPDDMTALVLQVPAQT